MKSRLLLATLVLLAVACEGKENEQDEAKEGKEKTPTAAMVADAKISEDSARVIALATVPGGTVTEATLEEENGALLWSFDIQVAGKSGIEEVHVDARTGAILKQEHETPADEAAEKAADSAAIKK